jgi:hypothetical protein
MEISQDEINDWALRASELASLITDMDNAMLEEDIAEAEYLLDGARPLAGLLARSLMRSANLPPARDKKTPRDFQSSYFSAGLEKSSLNLRAAEALEKAALLMLELDAANGTTTTGYGATLAEMAAEINLLVSRGEEPED